MAGWTSSPFVLFGSLPSVPLEAELARSGQTLTTTTPVPPGYHYLVINPDGNVYGIVNVIGTTSGIRWGWQQPLGQFAPLVVPIDPATDELYEINLVGGNDLVVLAIYASVEAPETPDPVSQTANLDLIAYTGDAAENVLPGSGLGSVMAVIDSISWTAFGASATAAALGHLFAATWIDPVVQTVAGVLATSAGLSNRIDFPQGLPIAVGTAAQNAGLWFAGNSTTTDFANVDITAAFHVL